MRLEPRPIYGDKFLMGGLIFVPSTILASVAGASLIAGNAPPHVNNVMAVVVGLTGMGLGGSLYHEMRKGRI